MSEKLAVVGFPSITKPADMLRDIMQYNFKVRTIHSSAECESCLQALQSEGTQIIAGDMISVTCAHRLGMHGLLIVSGIESVESTIDNAVEMNRYYSAIRKRATLFSDLFNSNDSDTIIYTSDGQEYFSTTSTLSQDIQLLLEQRISNVIAQGSVKIARHLGSSILSIKGRLLQSDGEDYCVYTLSTVSNIAMFDKYLIHYLSEGKDLPDCNPLEYYLGNSEEIVSIYNACNRYASMSNSVIILGDRGTGKDRFAHYIYAHSRLKHSSFVVIDVGLLDDKGWDFLLKNDNSPLTDSGLSIYFKRVNAATPAQQQQFLIYLKNSCTAQANRLFFSFTASDSGEPQGELYLYLTETMRCLHLRLPTLAQRQTDIPALVGLYINAINVQNGTRVVGLTHDAMLAMQNYNWSRNVDQLVQAVQDLVINAKTSYISEDQVQALLSRENQKSPALLESSINLNQPLDQIMQEVVLRVYESENLNQTHTAKRLGISRTTLWRMMK